MHFFADSEEKVRSFLCRNAVTYTIGAGIAVIVFLRGIWYVAEGMYHMRFSANSYEFWVAGVILVLCSAVIGTIGGIFVKCFIVDVVLLKGLKKEALRAQKTEAELLEEKELEKKIQAELTKTE